MRTPLGEVERILASADRHFRKYLADEPSGKQGLMTYAMVPMMREPELADRVIRQWEDAKSTRADGVPPYLACMHLVCACCAKASSLQDSGQINEAWANVVDAQLVSGIAMAQYVASSEVDHAASMKGRNGGKSKKSQLTMKYACDLFDQEGLADVEQAVGLLWSRVEKQARIDGWTMTLTGGPRTLRNWLKNHMESA